MQDCMLKRKLIALYEFAYKYFFPFFRWIKLRVFYRLRIMSSSKTIAYIKKHNCSIARYGDGEISYMMNLQHDIAFQQYSSTLSQKLKQVLENQNPQLLICLPRYVASLSGCTWRCKKYWWAWGRRDHRQEKMVAMLRNLTGRYYLYGDALVSRPYMDRQDITYAERIFDEMKSIWKDRSILIVEGKQTRLGVGNDLFESAKSIRRILAPAVGAFDYYERILDSVKKNCCNELILLALGPTATIMASDLADCGYQAIDIGHIDVEYEWFLRRASEKTAIEGKFVNEVVEGRSVGNCKDERYQEQIIDVIG